MKDKITMAGDDLRVSTWTIYFAHWPVNGIGGGAARRRLDRASTIAILFDQTFHMLGVRHMICMHIPSSICYSSLPSIYTFDAEGSSEWVDWGGRLVPTGGATGTYTRHTEYNSDELSPWCPALQERGSTIMVSEYTTCLMAETGTSTGSNGTQSSGRKSEKENTPRLVLALVHTLTTDD